MLPPNWPTVSDWTPLLTPSFASPQFQSLNQFIAGQRQEQTVYPSAENVFNAFRLTPFAATKVVILGQDPYHGPGQAHGLSFSVPDHCKIPPSLKNIFKELATEFDPPLRVHNPNDGNLTSWATQGVLLLNTVLTVQAGHPNSHAKRGWESFTDDAIGHLGQQEDRHVVFILWGKQAEKKASLISPCHTIIASPHPSPLSAHRGFFGSRPFTRANAALTQSGRTPIDWNTASSSFSKIKIP